MVEKVREMWDFGRIYYCYKEGGQGKYFVGMHEVEIRMGQDQ